MVSVFYRRVIAVLTVLFCFSGLMELKAGPVDEETAREAGMKFLLHFRQTTGVDEVTANALVYPNPTDGSLTVEASGMKHITVTNALGQVVMNADVEGDRLHLDLGNCRSGIYMLRVNTTNGMVVKKVSVTR